MSDGPQHAVTLMALVLVHLALGAVLGSAVSQLALRGPACAWQATMRRRAVTLRRAALAAGLLGLVALLLAQAAAVNASSMLASGPVLVPMLTGTDFGHAWLGGAMAWVLAGAFMLNAGPAVDDARPPLFAGLLMLAAFVFTRSIVSHAGTEGDFTADAGMDWLHLVLVGLWVGGALVGALLVPVDGADGPEAGAQALRWARHVASISVLALAGLVASGAFKVWRGIAAEGSTPAYLRSDYAHALGAKLLPVGVAAVLALAGRFAVLPREDRAEADRSGTWHRRFVLVQRLQVLALALALAAAAVLAGSEPPGGV